MARCAGVDGAGPVHEGVLDGEEDALSRMKAADRSVDRRMASKTDYCKMVHFDVRVSPGPARHACCHSCFHSRIGFHTHP